MSAAFSWGNTLLNTTRSSILVAVFAIVAIRTHGAIVGSSAGSASVQISGQRDSDNHGKNHFIHFQ
jgi:hypothetical protein